MSYCPALLLSCYAEFFHFGADRNNCKSELPQLGSFWAFGGPQWISVVIQSHVVLDCLDSKHIWWSGPAITGLGKLTEECITPTALSSWVTQICLHHSLSPVQATDTESKGWKISGNSSSSSYIYILVRDREKTDLHARFGYIIKS